MTTYFDLLPGDVKRLIDLYKNINILQDIINVTAVCNNIACDYYSYRQLINRWLIQGIKVDIKVLKYKLQVTIVDISSISNESLPMLIRDFISNINNSIGLTGINKVIEKHKLGFKLAYVNGKLQIIY